MKKIILTIVSIVLLISCVLYHSLTGGITAGADSGTGEKIESIKDLAELVGFFEDSGIDYLSAIDTELLYSSLSSSGKSSSRKGSSYDSCTVFMSTSLSSNGNSYSTWSSSSSYGSSGGNSNSSSHQSMSRELTVYFTKDATLYDSKGYLTSTSTSNSSSYRNYYYYDEYGNYNEDSGNYDKSESSESRTVIYFDLQLLFDDGDCYVYFKNYSYSTNEISMQIKNTNTYKWIECPAALASALLNVDSFNRGTFEDFAKMLDVVIESDYVDDDEMIFSLDANDFLDIAEELGKEPIIDFENADSDFKVDLSSPTTPQMSWIYDYFKEDSSSTDNYGTNQSSSFSKSVSLSEEISFSNIDNTKISFNDDAVAYSAKNEKKFEKLFDIDERRKAKK